MERSYEVEPGEFRTPRYARKRGAKLIVRKLIDGELRIVGYAGTRGRADKMIRNGFGGVCDVEDMTGKRLP